MSLIGVGIPFLARIGFIAEWGTASKAFEISTIVNTPLLFLLLWSKSALSNSMLILHPFSKRKHFCLKFFTRPLLSLPSMMEEKIWPRMGPNFNLINRLLALKMPKAMQRTVFWKLLPVTICHSFLHCNFNYLIYSYFIIYIAWAYFFFSLYGYFGLKFSTKFKFLE